MAEQVQAFIRYYELGSDGEKTGEVLYEGSFTGGASTVRANLVQISADTNLVDHEIEVTVTGTLNGLPTPLADWWEHIINP